MSTETENVTPDMQAARDRVNARRNDRLLHLMLHALEGAEEWMSRTEAVPLNVWGRVSLRAEARRQEALIEVRAAIALARGQ